MGKKVVPFVVVAAILVVAALLLLPTRPARVALSPEMKQELGAAAYVPQEVSAYASHKHLGRLWKQVWGSRAVQGLVALPFAQEAWTQLQRHPAYRGFMQASEKDPVLVQGLPIFQDAVSNEVFACTGEDFPGFLSACVAVLNQLRFTALEEAFSAPRRLRKRPPLPGEAPFAPGAAPGQGAPPGIEIIDTVLANGERLQVPSLLLGFKLTNAGAARQFLDTWIPKIGPTPAGTFQKQSLAGGEFYVLDVHGETVLRDLLRSLPGDLKRAGVPDDKSRQLVAWLAGLRLKLAIGLAGDYLIVSIGKETALLEQWGRGVSLAEAKELDPLRAHFKPGLQSVSYTSARMSAVFTPAAEDFRRMADGLAAALPAAGTPEGLKERIRKDVDALVKDIVFPQAGPSVAFSVENKGIETWAFGGPPAGGLDYSRPLSILAHRGKQPILYAASRAAKDPEAYDKAVKWLKVAYGYFEDLALPAFEPEDRKQFDKVMAFVNPFLTSFHEATRTSLIPAIDGAQYLFVFDGRGLLSTLPGGRKLPKPIPVPRLALAVELQDADKFTQAIERYAEAVRKLIDDARAAYPKQIPPGVTLPPPVVTDAAGGKLYTYAWPWDLGPDLVPCALLKGRLLILASSRELAVEMADPVPMPTSPVTAPEQAAGAVSGADCEQLWDFTRRATDAIYALIEVERHLGNDGRQEAMLVKMHFDALWRSLGAFRGYSRTATLRGGHVVTHSWLHVEDVAR